MVAGRGRLGAAVVVATRVVREIRRDLPARTKTLVERDVGGARLRHLGLQHLTVGSPKGSLAVPWLEIRRISFFFLIFRFEHVCIQVGNRARYNLRE